jgi:hypothetical protein
MGNGQGLSVYISPHQSRHWLVCISNFGITTVFAQTRHNAEDSITPLTERYKVVETLENDILLAEVLTVAGVFQPVSYNGLSGLAMLPAPISSTR